MTIRPESVDAYLASVTPEARSALQGLRNLIRDLAPGAHECISYGMPAFKLHGKLIAAYAAFKHHCSYFPCCSSILPTLGDEDKRYVTSKGTIRFGFDEPLPPALVGRLLKSRVEEVEKELAAKVKR